MPHTTKASCFYGKNTKWCTAATVSENLFLSYITKQDVDIILYYCINNTINNKYSKISIGVLNGQISATGQDGGLTVDSENNGLTLSDLEEIFEDEYINIIKAIKKHSSEINNKHPLKQEMIKIMNNHDEYFKYLNNKKENEKINFIKSSLDYSQINPEILNTLYIMFKPSNENKILPSNNMYIINKIVNHPKVSFETLKLIFQIYKSDIVKKKLLKDPNISPELLNSIYLISKSDREMHKIIIKNSHVTPEILHSIAIINNDFSTCISIINNPKVSVETLKFFSKYPNLKILDAISNSSNVTPEILDLISKTKIKYYIK